MSGSSNPLRILIVEDDPDFVAMLRMLIQVRFEAVGHAAADCVSAREALTGDLFDLVTLDFQLPDGNGLELLEEIASTDEHPPVIMVTGHGDEKTASEAIRLGADGYVVKDHRLNALLAGAIGKALERDRYRRSLLDSERQYRELVELANSIILKMDREGNVLFINRYGCEFFGYSEEELVGRNAVGTIVPEVESTGRGLTAMIRDIVTEPDAHRTNFNENMLRDGRRVWILWGNRSIRDGDGGIVGTLSIGNDVTELQRSTANLEHLASIYSLTISIMRMLRQPGDPAALLAAVCSRFVESGLFRMAWCGLCDRETGVLSTAGSAGDDGGLEQVVFAACCREWLEAGTGGSPVFRPRVFRDIPREATAEPWWEVAVKRGWFSSAALPLAGADRLIGALLLFTGTPGLFGQDVLDLLDALAQDISLTIGSPGGA